jgi:uncharacterized membrane protein
VSCKIESFDENLQDASEEEIGVSSRFFLFLAVGLILVFVGVSIIVVAAFLTGGGSGSFGGAVFIGPFPIVFGAGSDAPWVILVSIILAVLSVVLFMVMNRRTKTSGN